jgi:inosose dehydratase
MAPDSIPIELVASPDSWGIWFADDAEQIPWHRYLNEVAQIGFKWTELGPPGYLPTSVKRLRSELGSRQLLVPAAFVIGDLVNPSADRGVDEETRRTSDLLAQLGGKYVVFMEETYRDVFTGTATMPRSLDSHVWRRLLDRVNELARIVTKFGLVFAFHPHADTHVELTEQVEALIVQTDPNLVGLCLDTGHVEYRGGDSIELVRRHCDRIKYMHFKCVDPEVRTRVLLGDLPFGQAVAQRVFCEPSIGLPNFSALVRAIQSCGYEGWATVEQDLYPCRSDEPLPIVKRWITQLGQLGFRL